MNHFFRWLSGSFGILYFWIFRRFDVILENLLDNFIWKIYLTILFEKFTWQSYSKNLLDNFIWKIYLTILFGKFTWQF
jgi:hypothetical protein